MCADRKVLKTPRRPYEKERLDAELKLCGEYGLRAKRELWRVNVALSKIRQAARTLLTLDAKDPKRMFEGQALMRRLYKFGLLNETQDKLDYALSLTVQVRCHASATFTGPSPAAAIGLPCVGLTAHARAAAVLISPLMVSSCHRTSWSAAWRH